MYQSLEQFRKDPLFHVAPDMAVSEALKLAKSVGVHHLPVISRDELLGLVCTCDMEAAPSDAPVQALMHDPITLSLQHTRGDAVELMNECGIGSVILLDNEEARGIVTRADLVDSRPPAALADEISRCGCCGTTKHLRTNLLGRTLCIECRRLPRSAQLHVNDARP